MRKRLVWGGWVCASLVAVLILGGCGSSGGGQADTQSRGGAAGPSAAGATAQGASATATRTTASKEDFTLGTCEVTISGGVSATIKTGGGPSSINSEYWLSDSERLQLAVAVGDTQAAVQEKIAAGQFVLTPLLLTCGDTRTNVQLLATARRQDQLPFGAGSYRIAAGERLAAVTEGEFAASVVLSGKAYRSGGGTLDITRFDRSGITGSFRLEIDDGGAAGAARGTVVGRFEMSCTGVSTRGGCAR